MACGLGLAKSSGESTKVMVELSTGVNQVSTFSSDDETNMDRRLHASAILTLAAMEGSTSNGKKTKTVGDQLSKDAECMGECHSSVCCLAS